ncbi:hypothetical protein [Streptomyces shenzhenensis]|uniref:hypothetical protein n=1 Tax=Streptomyces shenzhenensis TaxID=943815 RepID=UPI0015F09488|nr:hypothetical protein [Streptomyces shenzhenensis]
MKEAVASHAVADQAIGVVIAQQVCPDLPQDTVGCFAADHNVGFALTGLEPGENDFRLPALLVQRGQLAGGMAAGIEQAGHQRADAHQEEHGEGHGGE